MIDFSHDEAILFRVLTSFFGRDHVIPHMSVLSICGGELPILPWLTAAYSQNGSGGTSQVHSKAPVSLSEWAKVNKCLFTIVNAGQEPRMVIEVFSGFEDSVTLRDVEHQRYLPALLRAAGVSYCTISNEELSEIVSPGSSLDFFSLLKAKCEALGMSVEA